MSDAADAATETTSEFELKLIQNAAIGLDIKDARDKALFLSVFIDAKTKAVRARDALCVVDAAKIEEIRRLQNIVAAYDGAVRLIAAAIQGGETAYQQLELARAYDGDDTNDAETGE